MTGVNPLVMWSVQRIEVTFSATGLAELVVTGTGFWFSDKRGRGVFATNRHNVDPTLKLGEHTPYRIKHTRVQLRRRDGLVFFPETEWYTITSADLGMHPTADVALFGEPQFFLPGMPPLSDYGCYNANFSDIADEAFLRDSVAPMDVASFVGFPGRDGVGWWDERWQAPIARTVNIASMPSIPFEHQQVPTADTMLVSGLSFSGSSGSPVFLHQQGIKPGIGISAPYVEPKIIGIMSGHWWEETSAGMFDHTGLSYLTRSTAIKELLQ